MDRYYILYVYPIDGDTKPVEIHRSLDEALIRRMEDMMDELGYMVTTDTWVDPTTINQNDIVTNLIGGAMGDFTIRYLRQHNTDCLVRKFDKDWDDDWDHDPIVYARLEYSRLADRYGWRITMAGIDFLLENLTQRHDVAAALRTIRDDLES